MRVPAFKPEIKMILPLTEAMPLSILAEILSAPSAFTVTSLDSPKSNTISGIDTVELTLFTVKSTVLEME